MWACALLLSFFAGPTRADPLLDINALMSAVPNYAGLQKKDQAIWHEIFIHTMAGVPFTEHDKTFLGKNDPNRQVKLPKALTGKELTNLQSEISKKNEQLRQIQNNLQISDKPPERKFWNKDYIDAMHEQSKTLLVSYLPKVLPDKEGDPSKEAEPPPTDKNDAAPPGSGPGSHGGQPPGGVSVPPDSSAGSSDSSPSGAGGGAPGSGATPNVAGKDAFKSLNKDAFGPEKQDNLSDPLGKAAAAAGAAAGRLGGHHGAGAKEGGGFSGGAGGAAGGAGGGGGSGGGKPAAGTTIAAGPGFGSAPGGTAGGSSGAGSAQAGGLGGGPGGGGGGGGLSAGGAGGSMGALGGPKIHEPAGAKSAPAAANKRGRGPGADDELTEEEKKELAEIQELLKRAAKEDSIDGEKLAGAVAKLPSTPPMQEIRAQISDILTMSGGELTMAQRQQVFALATKLGLSDQEAQALVHSVEHSAPPSLPSFQRPQSRWTLFWRRLTGLALGGVSLLQPAALSCWRRLLALPGMILGSESWSNSRDSKWGPLLLIWLGLIGSWWYWLKTKAFNGWILPLVWLGLILSWWYCLESKALSLWLLLLIGLGLALVWRRRKFSAGGR